MSEDTPLFEYRRWAIHSFSSVFMSSSDWSARMRQRHQCIHLPQKTTQSRLETLLLLVLITTYKQRHCSRTDLISFWGFIFQVLVLRFVCIFQACWQSHHSKGHSSSTPLSKVRSGSERKWSYRRPRLRYPRRPIHSTPVLRRLPNSHRYLLRRPARTLLRPSSRSPVRWRPWHRSRRPMTIFRCFHTLKLLKCVLVSSVNKINPFANSTNNFSPWNAPNNTIHSFDTPMIVSTKPHRNNNHRTDCFISANNKRRLLLQPLPFPTFHEHF